jgi:4-hydroxyphenylpyruvate dioxygenase-like putative hemolysin
MERREEITAKLDLPAATQIGVIVRDMEKAVEYYSKALGIGPFTSITDLRPDKAWYMGELHPAHLRVSRAMWGAMEFELIQPVSGKSPHHDFLVSNGEGINHLAIETTDGYDELVQRMKQAGFKPIWVLETYLPQFDCWGKANFFDTRSVGGIIIEVSSRPWLASWLGRSGT